MGWIEREVDQFEAPLQMLMVVVGGGGWVEWEVDQFEAPLQMLVVVVGGGGKRERSINLKHHYKC